MGVSAPAMRCATLLPMMSHPCTRRLLALIIGCAGGCHASHGRSADVEPSDRDAEAAPEDAAAASFDALCAPVDAIVEDLRCPDAAMPGETVAIEVDHRASHCCTASAAAGARVDMVGSDRATIEPRWDPCDCCPTCGCDPPRRTERVEVRMSASPLTVSAGDVTCTIAVSAPACHALAADDWLVPIAVLAGEPIPVTVRVDEGSGCGCLPRLALPDPLGTAIRTDACDCAGGACSDPGYEATIMLAARGAERGIAVRDATGATVARVNVWDTGSTLGSCGWGEIRWQLRALDTRTAPRAYVRDGEPALWVRLAWEEYVCCGRHALVRTTVHRAGAEISFEVMGCDLHCDCGRNPYGWVRQESDMFLGFYPPGRYRVSTSIDPDRVFSVDVDHR